MLNTHIYIVASFIAVVTVIDSFNTLTAWFIPIDIIFGWIPIIAQFILTQKIIRVIITNAKWRTLEQIQSEIRTFKFSEQDKVKATTDSINQLMDLHDRIAKTRNSTFDFKSGINLLNQLLLPVIGGLFGNIEKLFNLLMIFFGIKK